MGIHPQPGIDILHEVYEWLSDERNGKWLLILDIADDSGVFFPQDPTVAAKPAEASETTYALADFLPQVKHGTVLVTSRNTTSATDLVGSAFRIINVEPMNNEQALRLLEAKAIIPNHQRHHAKKLMEMLEGIPLAISQASAFISSVPNTSIANYIEFFDENENSQETLLDSAITRDLRRDNHASHSVIRTWQVSFEQVRKKSSLSIDILSLISVIEPIGIPKSFLRIHLDPLVFNLAFEPLVSFSLIKQNSDGKTCDIHSLVHFTMRSWLRSQNALSTWELRALILISEDFPDPKFENESYVQLLLPHAERVKWSRLIDDDAKDALIRLTRKILMYSLLNGSEWSRADQWYSRASAIEPANTLCFVQELVECHGYMAILHKKQRRDNEAEGLLRFMHEFFDRTEAILEPRKLLNMMQLAHLLHEQGRFEEAQHWCNAVIVHEKGEDPIFVLILQDAMFSLSRIHKSQGRLVEACKICIRLINKRLDLSGSRHMGRVLFTLYLSSLYNHRGCEQEAKGYFKKAITMSMPDVGDSTENCPPFNTFLLYSARDLFPDFEANFEEQLATSLHTQDALWGPKNACTLNMIKQLAILDYKDGRSSQAVRRLEELIRREREILREDHPDLLANIALLYQWKNEESGR